MCDVVGVRHSGPCDVAPAANKSKIIEKRYLERASLKSDKHTIMPAEGGHIREELSAYIDGALGAAEHEAVRFHMEGCALCLAEYEELSVTRDLLRSVPMIAPPRAFTLTKEMTAPARREGFWEKLLSPRNGSRLATGSALSFALVVMLLVGNLGLLGIANNASPAVGVVGYDDNFRSEGEAPASQPIAGTPGILEKLVRPEDPQAQVDSTTGDTSWNASSQEVPTAVAEAMLAPSPTAATAGGLEVAILTPGARRVIDATPSLSDRDGTVAQVTANPVSVSASVLATATAIKTYSNFVDTEATAEAVGRAAPQPARPREGYPSFDKPSGDGRGIYLGLVALFAALGVLLGAGALVARRRDSS